MGHMKDDIVESIMKILQNSEEKFPKGEDVSRGAQKDKYNVLVDQSSINKHPLT